MLLEMVVTALLAQIRFFLGPLQIIQKYKGCKLHPSKSKLYSL